MDKHFLVIKLGLLPLLPLDLHLSARLQFSNVSHSGFSVLVEKLGLCSTPKIHFRLCVSAGSSGLMIRCSNIHRWQHYHTEFPEAEYCILFRICTFSPKVKIILLLCDNELFISIWSWRKSPMQIHYISFLQVGSLLLF